METLLNFGPDVSYEWYGFPKTLLKKKLEFVSNNKNGIVMLYLSFVLLLVEVDPISEKQSHKSDALIACGTGYVKKVFVLLRKVRAIYI